MTNGKNEHGSKRITLGDVAKAAGVSVMTVSNVINGKHVGLVGPETLRRVQREIKRLNYRPHEIARSLRLARSSTIGMIIVHESHMFMAAPFVASLVTGLANALAESGYNLVTQGVHPKDFEKAALLQRVGIDGVVAHLAGPDRDRARFQRVLRTAGTPTVLIQDRRLTRLDDTCIVNQDDFHGARELALLLLELGARRLLFIKPLLDWPAVNERERGMRAAIAEHGSGADLAVVPAEDEDFASTQRAFRAYLDQNEMPEAILGSNDHIAVAAMKLVQSMGLRVPEDILVTGFNNFEYRMYTEPQLTTVQSQTYEMGFRAGTEMTYRLSHGNFPTPEITLPVSLVPGGSTRQAPRVAAGTAASPEAAIV